MLISRNKKYFMRKLREGTRLHTQSIDAAFQKLNKVARQKISNDRTAKFSPIREAPW